MTLVNPLAATIDVTPTNIANWQRHMPERLCSLAELSEAVSDFIEARPVAEWDPRVDVGNVAGFAVSYSKPHIEVRLLVPSDAGEAEIERFRLTMRDWITAYIEPIVFKRRVRWLAANKAA